MNNALLFHLFGFRSGWLHGNKCLREEDLHKCENRLEAPQWRCRSADTSSRSKRAQSLHLFCKKRLWYLVQNLVFHFLDELKLATRCVHKGKMKGETNRTFYFLFYLICFSFFPPVEMQTVNAYKREKKVHHSIAPISYNAIPPKNHWTDLYWCNSLALFSEEAKVYWEPLFYYMRI